MSRSGCIILLQRFDKRDTLVPLIEQGLRQTVPSRDQAHTPTFRVDLRQQRDFLLRTPDPPPLHRAQHVHIRHNVTSF